MLLVADKYKSQNLAREKTIALARRKAAATKENLHKINPVAGVDTALKTMCTTLFDIAQRHVANKTTAFSDVAQLLECAKLLQQLGVSVTIVNKLTAAAGAVDAADLLAGLPGYRNLKNKAIAGLSTIADLTEKPAAPGSFEFQSGVREGYRRASDIAASFLEDIQKESCHG
jgi:hypothetical protein